MGFGEEGGWFGEGAEFGDEGGGWDVGFLGGGGVGWGACVVRLEGEVGQSESFPPRALFAGFLFFAARS